MGDLGSWLERDTSEFAAHKVVYQCDVTREICEFTDRVASEAVGAFLVAHGINPKAMTEGAQLRVRRRPDGAFYLDTWRALYNLDAEDAPLSPWCWCCVKQERIAVDLAAPVPLFGTVFVSRVVDTVVVDDGRPLPGGAALPVRLVAPMAEPDRRPLSPPAARYLRQLAEVEDHDKPPGQ